MTDEVKNVGLESTVILYECGTSWLLQNMELDFLHAVVEPFSLRAWVSSSASTDSPSDPMTTKIRSGPSRSATRSEGS